MAYTLVLPEGQVLTVRFVDSAPVVLCHWTTDGNYPQIHSTTSKYQDRSKVSFRSPEKRRSYEDKIPCVPPGGKCGTQQDWQGSTSVRSSRVFTLISLPFWSDSVKGREGMKRNAAAALVRSITIFRYHRVTISSCWVDHNFDSIHMFCFPCCTKGLMGEKIALGMPTKMGIKEAIT